MTRFRLFTYQKGFEFKKLKIFRYLNLYSNTFLNSTYIIYAGETILKIFPRFNEPIEVFGNENDTEYVVINNTGRDIVNNSVNELQNNINLLLNYF